MDLLRSHLSATHPPRQHEITWAPKCHVNQNSRKEVRQAAPLSATSHTAQLRNPLESDPEPQLGIPRVNSTCPFTKLAFLPIKPPPHCWVLGSYGAWSRTPGRIPQSQSLCHLSTYQPPTDCWALGPWVALSRISVRDRKNSFSACPPDV